MNMLYVANEKKFINKVGDPNTFNCVERVIAASRR